MKRIKYTEIILCCMKAFIVQPTYRILDGKAFIHLYGRLENGESFLTINEFKPYFQIKKSDVEKANTLDTENIKFEVEEAKFKNYNDEEVIKIILDIPADVPKLRKIFEEKEIDCYEADIRFPYRFMMDKKLLSSCNIEGDYEKGDYIDRVYNEPTLTPIETKGLKFDLRTLSFDIETDGLSKKLFSIALYSDRLKTVILVRNEKIQLENTIVVSNEKEALLKFNELILKLDPDIITGWNVIDFDMAFLSDKYKQLHVPFLIGRDSKEAYVRIEENFMASSRAFVPGRVVLDGIDLLRNTFYKLSDYKLDTAAQEFLGEKKLIGNENKVKEIEDAYNNNPKKLVEYNLKDAELVYNILEKQELISLAIHRALLVGMPLDRVQASVASLDSLYLRELNQIGYVANSVKVNRKEKGVVGGFVMKSKPGIYDNVIVCDFKSLYPSLMRTFNIDPLSFARGKTSKDYVEAPNGARFDKKEGLLPNILKNLWKARDVMKKENNQTGSYAIKIHMNSMYGVLANPSCRFFDFDLANAITTFGREIIQSAAELIREKGFDVIYGDTDSIFVNLLVNNVEEAKKIGKEIEKTVNEHYNKFVKEKYGRENLLEMEFEKLYTRFMMPHLRGSKVGAKKRYAGLLLKDGKEEIDFTGLEMVRRDWTALAKKFQLELLNKIFYKKEVGEYIRDFVVKLKEGGYDELLVYRKALRKSTEEYTKTTPPHVKVARMLEEIGKLDSTIIEYVMTLDGPRPKNMLNSKVDYEHYIEKQIKPLANQVLSFYDTDFDSLIEETSQSSLFDF